MADGVLERNTSTARRAASVIRWVQTQKADARLDEVPARGMTMRDPRSILAQASQGGSPHGWAVFATSRGRIRGFFTGTSGDPDPLLVVTPEGIVEFVDSRTSLQVVDFDQLSDIALRIRGRSFSDSRIVHLDVWLDLRYRDGRAEKWKSSTFSNDYRTIQSVLEAYGAHKMLLGGR